MPRKRKTVKYIMLKRELWPLVKKGIKKITIRRSVRFSEGEEVLIHAGGKIVGRARITNIYRKKMKSIGAEEAEKEGIPLPRLKKMLENTYGKNPEQELTVVEFELVEVFDPPLDPEKKYYGDKSPQEIAEEALKKGMVKDPFEREVLKKLAKGKSIREIAFELGGLEKRKIIRRIVRKYGECLSATS